MCSFDTPGIEVGHKYFLLFREQLHLFVDIYLRIDIMIGMVEEDFLMAYFVGTRSDGTKKKANTPNERTCQSKIALIRIETK